MLCRLEVVQADLDAFGRNTAVYNKAMHCGNFIAGAGLNEVAAR
ncbi:MAG TPA: hypothetical protein VFY56_08625 [Propionibacteriaceae bacterium]|nr:hypothetical protein [Propionibacteriaceae bacterium]